MSVARLQYYTDPPEIEVEGDAYGHAIAILRRRGGGVLRSIGPTLAREIAISETSEEIGIPGSPAAED